MCRGILAKICGKKAFQKRNLQKIFLREGYLQKAALQKGILQCGLLVFASVLLGACSPANSGGDGDAPKDPADDAVVNEHCADDIRARGYLTVGCKMDVPGFGLYEEASDAWSGLEVELAYQTAANLFDVSIQDAKEQGLVKFVGVTVADREEKLAQGEVDCLFATYTITEERKGRFAFSNSYYTDYIGLMVKDFGEDPNALGKSGIRSTADLDGKYIGVAKNATTRKMFLDYIDTMNALKTSPIFMEYDSYSALFGALKKGDIDVMAVDVSILNGYVDHTTKILGDRFGGQHYGAAVRKEDAPLLEYVNQALSSDTAG